MTAYVLPFPGYSITLYLLPIAFAITFFSARIQEYFQSSLVKADVALEESVQECIESLQDLKANNAEESYLKGLNKKIDDVEKRHIIAELGVAIFVVSGTLILSKTRLKIRGDTEFEKHSPALTKMQTGNTYYHTDAG